LLKLALKLLLRDWRAGELTLLLASLIVAVSTVTTITLFADRLQRALLLESASFIAADRVISSSRPIPNEFLEKATEIGLSQARTLSFLSMAFAQNRSQFTAVKAVDENYPLRGKLIAGHAPFESGSPVPQGPVPGEVWIESRLFPSLGLSPGDHIELGRASFPATRVLLKEPDRGGGFSAAGPRLLMNLRDVEATEVVQPGSRLTYRYLFSGQEQQLEIFEAWATSRLPDDSRLIGAREGAESIGDALQRAESFLLLGGLLGVVLAGVAIALSAQRYSNRHFDHVAILKTLGATPANIDKLFLVIFLVIGITATAIGSLIGYLMQIGVITMLGPLIPVELPLPGL
jgi:putative ABC transport system permease protein